MNAASWDPTAPGGMALLALLALRVGGLLLVAPVFSARTVPVPVRTGLLVVLTLALLPAALAGAAPPPRLTPATFLSETLIGFSIGLGAAVFVGAAELAGDVIAIQAGLSSASALDPLTQHSVPTLSQFTMLFALTLLVAAGGHLLLIEALGASTRVLPIGAAIDVEPGLRAMIGLGGTLFQLGVRFAAPVTAAVLISNLALGVLARTAPQLNILMVAFPVQIGVGLFTLAVALSLIATAFASWPATFEGLASHLLRALGAR